MHGVVRGKLQCQTAANGVLFISKTASNYNPIRPHTLVDKFVLKSRNRKDSQLERNGRIPGK